MITFAFAQLVFVAAFRWKWLTGGSDGILVPSPTLFGLPTVLQSREQFYFFVLAVFAICTAVVLYLIATTAFAFGHTIILPSVIEHCCECARSAITSGGTSSSHLSSRLPSAA